ncbi:SRPBCC family protein [Nocardioides marmotae]|uniref:SRPBCC family protein n=1 Tax=Nocardioides marmotae TaxID=2663857 RepID=UPI0012B57CD7|nr:SRPBCC family protein [Nocardioides marmotae]MBC9734880.1 SRPBCC family protein [Nocardioides marmotae]MTB85981.1 carbon monoxide dehydrogenase [Nocardioides marmotae]
MDLRHEFTVPTGVEETWAHFNDIASVAECFPGAVVTGVEDDTFTGTVKVKLGPIALVYGGSGTFVDKDESAHSFVVEAKGKDKRGNGTAGATVTLTMAEAAGGATDVVVVTDLAITGKPAQFGRGVMQDVSDKLLGQFVACLEQRLSAEPEPEPEPEAASAPDATPAETPAATPAATPPADTVAADEVTPVVADTGPAPAAPRPAPAVGAGPGGGNDALDLGASVLPVLLKSYGKQVGIGLLVVLVLVLLRRRRHH